MKRRDRGQILPRGEDRWLVRAYVGTTTNGKRKYASRMIRGSVTEARRGLTALLRDIDTQTYVQPSNLALGDYLTSWLDGRIDISPRTLVSYRGVMKRVQDSIGHLKLERLTRAAIQGVFKEMTEAGLSRRTIELTRTVLKSALEDAVRENLILRNPADHTELPPKRKRPPSILSPAETQHLIVGTADDPFHALWVVLLTTGIRPSEAYGLKWGDLQLEAGEPWMSVIRSVTTDGHGKAVLSETTKTEGSVRRIGLAQTTVAALTAHKKRQLEEILKCGPRYQRDDLVFASSIGTPIDHNRVRRAWKATLKRLGLPPVRLYDTRHSHLTALLAAGADIAWVAARAGHKDIKMTRDHYAHVMPETHRAMGAMTERILNQAKTNLKENKQ